MRWSILNVVYYSNHGKKRVLDFSPRGVTIITGRSNTGKTAIIKTVDYCLGSSSCDIPIFIRRRCACVALKLTNGMSEIFVARDIPTGASSASETMYFSRGHFVGIPDGFSGLVGRTKKDAARALLEQAFGIERINQEGFSDNRVSLRQSTAFMFLSKEVIDSDVVLLHGLSHPNKARHVVGALPYFLGVTTEEGVLAEYRMGQLKQRIRQEVRESERVRESQGNLALSGSRLLAEAIAAGITESRAEDASLGIDITLRLKETTCWKPEEVVINDSAADLYSTLQRARLKTTQEIKKINSEVRAAKEYASAVGVFSDAIEEQSAKAQLIYLFEEECGHSNCPVCSAPLHSPQEMHQKLRELVPSLISEHQALSRYIPNITCYLKDLDVRKNSFKAELDRIDAQLSGVVAEMESVQKLYDANQKAAHVIGRISYFIEEVEKAKKFDPSTLEALERELYDLEVRFGADEKRERMFEAQAVISQYASEFFKKLPRDEQCLAGELFFDASKPTVFVRNFDEDERIRFSEMGSDENYLSIHMALYFALQRFFTKTKRPIPAVLLLDQVSRPYYSNNMEKLKMRSSVDSGPDEVEEFEVDEDDDSASLRMYFDFIFNEARKNEELQVIVLEHAYLYTMPEYVTSTKYRWNKADGEKLIPDNWPLERD